MTPGLRSHGARGRHSRAGLLLLLALMGASVPLPAQTTLIATGSVWRYRDDGTDAGAAWRGTDFDDSAWLSGPAQLGYGEGDEATVTASRPGMPYPVTIYFRHSFVLSNGFVRNNLTLRLLRDDGAIVFLNSNEVYRSNMPEGPVNYLAPAATSISGDDETVLVQRSVWPYYLVPGTNAVAVEVHQSAEGGGDCSFDLALIANLPYEAPAVRILSPTNGSSLDSETVTITTATEDPDGHVWLVEFYAGTNQIGRVDTPPFTLFWTNPPPGRYALRAEALDNSGRRGVSPRVYIQVGAGFEDRITRGPYLQTGTPTSVVVRWRTDWFTDSLVHYGPDPGFLDWTAYDPARTIEHEVRLTGLSPTTTYFYAVGTGDGLMAGGPDYFFETVPTNARPTRIWVIGDSGTADLRARAVRDAYEEFSSLRRTDLWLMLGDNAYEVGSDEEYQAAVFEMYPRLLRQSVLWPTLGNHDTTYLTPAGELPYFDMFTLPQYGEAGGVASGTEKYYSFDYANIHFVCLDSHLSERTPGSSMLTWLERDLAATSQDWIIAFFHGPPYTWGTHNSDREADLTQTREYVLPVLENYGVDLVLSGHSHVYERSFLLNGHYGFSSNLTSDMILDAGSGRADTGSPYRKPAGGLGARQGTVYVVCGCSGEGGLLPFPRHPAIATNLPGNGSVVLDIDGLRLDARLLQDTGEFQDSFTMLKGPPASGVRPDLRISRSSTNEVHIAWPTSLRLFRLEGTAGLGPDAAWNEVPGAPATSGRSNVLAVPLSPANRIFRLRAE